MSDQWLVLLFCMSLAFVCSLATAFFYQLSIGQVLRKLRLKGASKAPKLVVVKPIALSIKSKK